MASAVCHRGPDAHGYWADDGSAPALGHRRLSIIDLTPEGAQPMISASGRFVIAYNGEVYNFIELREELVAAGVRFRGRSDTEVMLAAIEKWGVGDATKRFVGMFAFAIWDRQRRVLHLVRDRIGEKPLFYGWSGGTLLFGSELKALRQHPSWRGVVDRNALALFLRYNYVPSPYSIYEGIHKLTPGTMLTFRENDPDSAGEEYVYWSAEEIFESGARDPIRVSSDDEAVDELEKLLTRSVRSEMVADVPLGAFLSGGIDSSLIVALMQANNPTPVRTFTIGFHERAFDEGVHARAVAKHLGTDHTELYVTPAEMRAVIPRMPHLYDEPFADSSQIPTFLVAQLARASVTVSLSGDGADEIFGGYNRYFWGKSIWGCMRFVPRRFRAGASRGLTAVPSRGWDAMGSAVNRVFPTAYRMSGHSDKVEKLAGVVAARNTDEMYRHLVSNWGVPTSVVLNSSELQTRLSRAGQLAAIQDPIVRMMYLDVVSYLPDDILVKVDRATMGVGLEARAPYLDHRVVEYAARLPLSMKIRHGKGKWLLRQVLYRHVPARLMERPKMGFGIPLAEWLRGPLREWAEDLLSMKRLKEEGFFRPEAIREKWSQHLSGQRNWHARLWSVLMFQAWKDA
jgi:asparagine synthase (glutamine-hydrolysing)